MALPALATLQRFKAATQLGALNTPELHGGQGRKQERLLRGRKPESVAGACHTLNGRHGCNAQRAGACCIGGFPNGNYWTDNDNGTNANILNGNASELNNNGNNATKDTPNHVVCIQ